MMSNHVLLLIMCFVGSECQSEWDVYIKQPAFADQMCAADQVGFQVATRDAVSCLWTCYGTPDCRSLVYLHGNRTCFGLQSHDPFAVASPLPGAVFYRPINNPMVEGAADNQFNASDYKNYWYPWSSRLSSTSFWNPPDNTINEWLQIDFLVQVRATHVITKGSPDHYHWVKSYTVLTSTNCAEFVTVTDANGNERVFPGNWDRSTSVKHRLEPHVDCRCVRINPRTWKEYIDLRFEVLGRVL